MKLNALLQLLACLVFSNFGCDKCKDIACVTPPAEFSFQLLDKDNGEDLVANGTFEAGEVSVYSLADQAEHGLLLANDSTTYIFTDQAIGWKTGEANAQYELRLSTTMVLPFTYQSKELNGKCCTFYEFEKFELPSSEILFIPQLNLFQLKI